MSLRVLIVDDTLTYRTIVAEALRGIPDIEVLGSARNGREALEKMASLKPDVITLDLEMPDMNGIDVLRAIRDRNLPTAAIMVSAFTSRGGAMTIEALEAGAFDFVTKSDSVAHKEQLALLREKLTQVLRSLARRRRHPLPVTLRPRPAPGPRETVEAPPTLAAETPPVKPAAPSPLLRLRRPAASMILIGVSTGGPNALARLIPALPASLPVPIFIVQHMPPLFTAHLAESLNRASALRVKEGEDNEVAQPGCVYIAPGGMHMKLAAGPEKAISIQLSDAPPENHCRPSVDVLFRSAALQFPGKACAAILTGMGNDGTQGCRLLKRSECIILAQDEASCVVYGMPKEAVQAGVVDAELPLEAIAPALVNCVEGRPLC